MCNKKFHVVLCPSYQILATPLAKNAHVSSLIYRESCVACRRLALDGPSCLLTYLRTLRRGRNRRHAVRTVAGTAEASRRRSREISTSARERRPYPHHAGRVRHRDVIAVHSRRQLYGHLFGQRDARVGGHAVHSDHVVGARVRHVPCETAHEYSYFVRHLRTPRVPVHTHGNTSRL